MKIDRRRFLKLASSVLVSTAIPLPKSKNIRGFDPTNIYFNYVYLSDWDDKTIEFAKEELIKQIRLAIPSEYCNKKYIKFIYHPPCICGTGFIDPMNMRGTVAWKYTPERKKVSSPRGA